MKAIMLSFGAVATAAVCIWVGYAASASGGERRVAPMRQPIEQTSVEVPMSAIETPLVDEEGTVIGWAVSEPETVGQSGPREELELVQEDDG